jgi:hypothetical protein
MEKFKAYYELAKSIFPEGSIQNHFNSYLELDGEKIFGKRCIYSIMQYDGETLYIPHHIGIDECGNYYPALENNEVAGYIPDFVNYSKPSLKKFEEVCLKYLKTLKEVKMRDKLIKIEKDFK